MKQLPNNFFSLSPRDQLQAVFTKHCMLTGVNKNLTYHHIQKQEHGGPKDFDNGAILSSISQRWLHTHIEHNDPRLFSLINDCLRLYKAAYLQERWDLVHQWQQEIYPLVSQSIINLYGSERNNKEVKILIRTREHRRNSNEK